MVQRLCIFGAMSVLLLLSSPSARGDEKKMLGWNVQEVSKVIPVLVDLKWRPVAVKGYAGDKESLFDITWERRAEKEKWYIYLDMSADGFENRKAEGDKAGFKVVVTSRWRAKGEDRFAAIWYPK